MRIIFAKIYVWYSDIIWKFSFLFQNKKIHNFGTTQWVKGQNKLANAIAYEVFDYTYPIIWKGFVAEVNGSKYEVKIKPIE